MARLARRAAAAVVVAVVPGAVQSCVSRAVAEQEALPAAAVVLAAPVALEVVQWSACDADVWAVRQLQAAMVEQAGRGAPGARVA